MKPKDERRTVKLTKTTVERMEPGETLWDSEIVGFGARRRSYRPSYVVKYGGGRRGLSRMLTIGKHGGAWLDADGNPCVLTAERARTEALRLRGEVAKGGDPAAARARLRGLPTLEEFSERYLTEYAKPHKKPRSYRENVNSLKPILRKLAKHRIDRITHADVTRYHLSRKSTPTSANREVALLSHMFTMAARWGLRSGDNPCRHVPKFPEAKRKRYLSEVEIGRLALSLTEAEPGNPFGVAALRLALFIGARRNEVLTLQWSEVDLTRGALEVGDSKTGAKTIQLNAPAVSLLAALPRLAGNPYVFPGRKPGEHIVELASLWKRIRTAAEIPDVRIHDLRHSFASVLVSGGASLPLIGGLLGHSNPKTTARYAHLSNDPLRAASERAGEAIVAAMKRGAK